MSDLTADQARLFVHTLLLEMVKRESHTTKSVLAAVPNAHLDYRPDPNAKTAQELVRHIAAAEVRFLKTIVDGAFVPDAVKIPDEVNSPQEVSEWYQSHHAIYLEAIRELRGEQLVKMIDFRGMFQQPAYLFLQIALVHSIHHRGQLSTYLRPMGGKVPAIYGESYDSSDAKRAARAKVS